MPGTWDFAVYYKKKNFVEKIHYLVYNIRAKMHTYMTK